MDVDSRRERDRVEGGKDALLAAHATGWLTLEDATCGTTLIDDCNRFNEMIRLEMFWMVRLQLLQALVATGRDPVIILSRGGVTQGDPLYMVLLGSHSPP